VKYIGLDLHKKSIFLNCFRRRWYMLKANMLPVEIDDISRFPSKEK